MAFPITCPTIPRGVTPKAGIKINPALVESEAQRGNSFTNQVLAAKKIQPNIKIPAPEAKPIVINRDLSRTANASGLVWATARRTNKFDHSREKKSMFPTSATQKAIVPNAPEVFF